MHSSILAWKIPWTEEPGGLWPWAPKELATTEVREHVHKIEPLFLNLRKKTVGCFKMIIRRKL